MRKYVYHFLISLFRWSVVFDKKLTLILAVMIYNYKLLMIYDNIGSSNKQCEAIFELNWRLFQKCDSQIVGCVMLITWVAIGNIAWTMLCINVIHTFGVMIKKFLLKVIIYKSFTLISLWMCDIIYFNRGVYVSKIICFYILNKRQ